MSKKIKDEQKKFLGETLNQYDKALDEVINQLDKKNREQNHKISSLVNSFDNEYLEKDVEGNMTTLENSKDGMVIINEIQGSTEVNYCKDGEKELILNGDIDTQGESFVTITEGVDGGLVDVSLEGNTEINLSKTKDPVLVTREFDDINCNVGKLQYTIDDVTTINDEPGKVDIDRIVGDTMVNHAVNGSEELILNAHINESGDNSITLNGVTSDGGKVDVALEGNTLVNVSNVKDDYITPTIEDKVDQGSVISLPEVSEGLIHIDEIEGNTLVNYCTDGAKELTLNGDIDVEGNFVTVTEGADNGLVDVTLEGNTLVNLVDAYYYNTNIYVRVCSFKEGMLKPSTKYSAIITNPSDENLCVYWNEYVFEYAYISIPAHTTKVFTTTTKSEMEIDENRTLFKNAEEHTQTIQFKAMLLEGDWTNKEIPQYFEGMKSVGQDDENGHKVEISSRNKNLFDGETELGVYNFTDGVTVEDNTNYARTVNYINVKSIDKITISSNQTTYGFRVYLYDTDKKHIENTLVYSNNSLDVSEAGYIRMVYNNTIDKSTIQIEEGSTVTDCIPHSSNKKEILLNEPLRGLPNGVKDQIVKIGGKWFVERNCGSIGFNEIINAVVLGDSTKEETIRFKWKSDVIPSMKPNSASNFYCNNFKYAKYSDDIEGIDIGKDLDCNILRSKLQTQDIDGFKQWVGNNPTTIIYELATPTYEPLEIEPTLNTYNEVTHLSNNSIIPCNMQIKNTGYNTIIKPSTLYTVALDTNKSGTVVIDLGGMKTVTTNNVVTITTPAILSDDSLRIYGKGIKGSKVRLLEGDKTNWIPSFFEGIQSSFEDKVQDDGSYKMELLMKNKNLADPKGVYDSEAVNDYLWKLISSSNGEYICRGNTENPSNSYAFALGLNLYNLKPNTTYCVSYKVNGLYANARYAYKGTNNLWKIPLQIPVSNNIFTTPKGITEVCIGLCYKNPTGETVTISEIQVEEGSERTEYVPYKENKIQFSSIEPLRGINEIHDRLVFKDGKLMIERNCKQENMSELKFAGDTRDTMKCLILFKSKPKAISNIFSNSRGYESATKGQMYVQERGDGMTYLWIPTDSMSREEFTSFLNEKNATIVYAKAEPTYEEIPYDLQKIILESYDNGTLFFDTNIPPTKVSFNCFEEELTYLYPSTSYTVQFNSDRTTTADITLGGTQLLAQNIVKGLNRITITTPSTLVDNKLIINGVGAKISDVVVTDTNREFKYFEGMKSVGENGLKIYSGKPQRFGKGGRI